MQEALRLVRADLGDDAAVLHTREVGSGLLRWFRRTEIEVTASNEVDIPSQLSSQSPDARQATIPEPVAESPDDFAPSAGEFADYRLRFRELLHQESDDDYSVVESLCQSTSVPEPTAAKLAPQLRQQLLSAGVDETTTTAWIAQWKDVSEQRGEMTLREAQELLLKVVEAELVTGGGIQLPAGERRVVALVGSTGVGKTTTVAKLAAQHRLQRQVRVGLVTIDTYRIAAVDQLKTYADIMNLPLEVASSPREMQVALHNLSDCQLVLIDTTGRSPRDAMRIAEQRSMLSMAEPDEVQLVLSAASSTACQQLAMRAYASVNPTSLLLTKLDELPQLGSLAGLLRECALPLSYSTHGQNVPDDIRVVERRALARQLTGFASADWT